jgi:hypothetical protein
MKGSREKMDLPFIDRLSLPVTPSLGIEPTRIRNRRKKQAKLQKRKPPTPIIPKEIATPT